MDVTVTKEEGDIIEFDVSGTSPAFANALRRTLTGNVPTMAIEEVTITRNNTGLFDEILAHRLGMVPWTYNPEDYELQDEYDEEDWENTVTFALHKEGEGEVTAGDLKPSDETIEAKNPETKIVDLQEDGELELEARAHLGLGKEHAKWQAANAAYSYEEGDDTFHFTVESVSGLDPRTLVNQALDRLEDRLDEFEEVTA